MLLNIRAKIAQKCSEIRLFSYYPVILQLSCQAFKKCKMSQNATGLVNYCNQMSWYVIEDVYTIRKLSWI